MRVRTLLAGVQSNMRCCLRLLLERSGEVEVVAETNDGQAAFEIAVRTRPDLVILDDLLPSMRGVEVTRRLSKSLPDIGVIALSRSCDRRTMTSMLEAGARGYLLRTCELAELLKAVQVVAGTGYYLCGPALDQLVAEYLVMADPRCTGLPEREMVIDVETMEHVRKNMQQLGIDPRQLVVRGRQEPK